MLRSIITRFGNIGLQQRIMLFVTAGLVAFSAIYAYVALQAIGQATDLVFRERVLAARAVARGLDDSIAHVEAEVEDTGVELSNALGANRPGDARKALGALYARWSRGQPEDASLVLVLTDLDGHVLQAEPQRPDLIGGLIPQAAVKVLNTQTTSAVAQSALLVDDAGAPTALIWMPIHAGLSTVGFLLGQVPRSQIQQWLVPATGDRGSGYAAELIDDTGKVIASNLSYRRTVSTEHLRLVQPLWQVGAAGARIHQLPSGDHVIAFAPLQHIAWGVIVEQETDDALILPRTLGTQFAGFGVVALLGGLALAWVTTRAVVRPVLALTGASKFIAAGDLDHPLDISGQGELGSFARSFDDMRRNLKSSREEIGRWNRELSARVQQRTRELRALVESSHALTSTLDLEALFAILMAETREVLPPAEGISLFLHQPDTDTLIPHSTDGFDASELRKLRFSIGEGIAGRVFETQAPALLRTAAEVAAAQDGMVAQNRAHFGAAVGEREVRSALGVPLVSKGVRLGALMLFNFSREDAFVEGDVPVLQALADQAAAAIENARLYAEVQHKEAIRTQLLEKVIEAQEAEHKRIARDLHDEFAQTLTALTINLQSTVQALPEEMSGLRRSLSETQALTAQMLKEISMWILELRPTVLDDLGLVPAIRWYAETRLDPQGIHVTVDAGGLKQRFAASMEASLFRIAQEAVTNIAKYARATSVRISVEIDRDRIRLMVEDDGVGFDMEDALSLKDGMRGLGLLGMRERAVLLGGTLSIESSPGRGTRVNAQIPWKERA